MSAIQKTSAKVPAAQLALWLAKLKLQFDRHVGTSAMYSVKSNGVLISVEVPPAVAGVHHVIVTRGSCVC